MKPQLLLAEAVTPDGAKITLHERDGRFAIRIGGRELMNSAIPSSELLLAELGLQAVRPPARVLVGGLGLGFTLKRLLEIAGPELEIVVVELLPVIVDWNRTHLAGLNGGALDDPRVKVVVDDVRRHLFTAKPGTYDAILLDVDNGPSAMVSEGNERLYSGNGLHRLLNLLPPGGRLCVWSASIDNRFTARMERVGYTVGTVRAKTHKGSHCSAYAIFVGDKPLVPRPPAPKPRPMPGFLRNRQPNGRPR